MKKVFELALSGRNTTQIAYGMNELNLPTPGLYAKRKNLLMGSNPIIARTVKCYGTRQSCGESLDGMNTLVRWLWGEERKLM